MKKYFFIILGIILIGLSLMPQDNARAQRSYEHHEMIDGVYYTIIDADMDGERDNYAIIEYFDFAENVIDGVYTFPSEIIYNGKVYPIVGINGSCDSGLIKEVIVPKEFGSKKVKTDYYHFEKPVGYSNFFNLPNVEKVSIYAEDINISSVFSDGGGIEYRSGTPKDTVLREINIYSKKVTIDKYALSDLSNLEALNFSKDTQVILKKYGIINCGKITNLTLPAKTKFTEGAVSRCKNLNSIEFMKGSRYTINQGVISPVGTLLFVPANVKEYQVPSSVKKIGALAFSNCKKIKTVTSGAKIIGEYAFYDCKTLTSIKLKKTTEKIESCAFALSGLISFEIPKSVKSIGHGILYNTESLRLIKTSGKYYKSKNGALTSFSGKTLLAVIPKNGAINIPSGVITTRGLFITAPSKVKSMKFPSSIRVIFQVGERMPKLTKITFSSTVIPKAQFLGEEYWDMGVGNVGYYSDMIEANTDGKLEIHVPAKEKQNYKKFIKKNINYGITYKLK